MLARDFLLLVSFEVPFEKLAILFFFCIRFSVSSIHDRLRFYRWNGKNKKEKIKKPNAKIKDIIKLMREWNWLAGSNKPKSIWARSFRNGKYPWPLSQNDIVGYKKAFKCYFHFSIDIYCYFGWYCMLFSQFCFVSPTQRFVLHGSVWNELVCYIFEKRSHTMKAKGRMFVWNVPCACKWILQNQTHFFLRKIEMLNLRRLFSTCLESR